MFLGTRLQTKNIDERYVVCLPRFGGVKFLGITKDANLHGVNKKIMCINHVQGILVFQISLRGTYL